MKCRLGTGRAGTEAAAAAATEEGRELARHWPTETPAAEQLIVLSCCGCCFEIPGAGPSLKLIKRQGFAQAEVSCPRATCRLAD